MERWRVCNGQEVEDVNNGGWPAEYKVKMVMMVN